MNSFPMSVKLAVLLAVISEHSLLFLSPIVITYQIEHVSVGSSQKQISYRIGFQEGLTRLLSAIGVLLWTSFSDRIGRKYCLAITMSGIAISSIAGGLCTTYSTLLFWRAVSGLFSGTIPIIKAIISDISDDTNISVLYKYFASGYGFASIIGPLIGGLLSQPYELSSAFDVGFFRDYPYFLPFFTHSCISLSALIFISLKIPYKAPENRGKAYSYRFTRNRKFMSITAIFFVHGFVQFSYRTLMSLWLKTDENSGGIGWGSEMNPGIMNGIGGILVAVFPFFFNPILSKKYKPAKSILLLNLILIPFLVVISCCNYFNYALQWAVLVICNGSIIAFITMGTSFISICITNSLPARVIGKGIGISQAFTSISRSISATTTALIYGELLSEDFSFPMDTHFLFILNCIILLLNVFIIICFIGENLDKREVESDIPDINEPMELGEILIESK